ncbi:MAG TPA: hypothetical protein DEB06_11120 [Phycisphaerales bacterium]|nr:hypothetical protein [Phycisphaerales bacterium]
MNKGDLVDRIAAETKVTKSEALKLVDAVIRGIVEGVQSEEKVSISGFGTFRKRFRKARTGINPVTRKPIQIDASTTVGFTASSTLRNGV